MKLRKMPILPVESYNSQLWFREEQKKIFANTWQYAGLIEDLKNPGDYLTVQCGLQNILVVKGRDQRLRAFHNLCRHRGTQLLRSVGKDKKVITCPYHDWTYDLEGNLISIPERENEFPDIEIAKHHLHKASVDVWRGIIWVHPKPDAQAINQWFAGCEKFLGPHQPEKLVEYPGTTYIKEIKANWKIIVENYIDVYHLSHLHSHTLNMYDHANAQYNFIGDHYLFWEPLSKKYRENLDRLIPYKRIGEVKDQQLGAYVPWLFPSLGLVETESSWSIFHVIPLAPDLTKVVVRSKLEKTSTHEYSQQEYRSQSAWGKIMGNETKYEGGDESDPMASGDFMEEDIFACEQQQKSLDNPLFNVSVSARNQESTIRQFQMIIDKWYNK
jgi:phenylpropionate dioxygenase-like ring-hydroxylating dioxygenase large terminal subunit